MKFNEAFKLVLAGERIHRPGYDEEGAYIHLDSDGDLVDEEDCTVDFNEFTGSRETWAVYKESGVLLLYGYRFIKLKGSLDHVVPAYFESKAAFEARYPSDEYEYIGAWKTVEVKID